MTLLCLLVFGISSVFHASLEQMPEMETPMMTIMARYEGAGPEDISELVTEPIEDAVSTLEGVKASVPPPATVLPGLCWSMIMELTWMRRIMS